VRRRKFTQFENTFIKERANYCCEYCKFPIEFSHDAFHIEHIISLLLGGNNELHNLALACDGCNTNKRAYIEWIDLETGEMYPLFNPRKEVWSDQFSWSEDFTIIIGKTPQSRATIDLLKLNRSGLINVRSALISYGVYPRM
jgi:HNH endonuclease